MITPKVKFDWLTWATLVFASLAAISYPYILYSVLTEPRQTSVLFHPLSLGTIILASWSYLLYQGRLVRKNQSISMEEIVGVGSLPRYVKLHLANGETRVFERNHFDLYDLRRQLSTKVLGRLVKEVDSRLARGESLDIHNRHFPLLMCWIPIAVLASFISLWLALIPVLLLACYFSTYRKRVVASLGQEGFVTVKGEFFFWTQVTAFAQANLGTLAVGEKIFILNVGLQEKGWLISRLAQNRIRCGVYFPSCGPIFKDIFNQHAQFVGNA